MEPKIGEKQDERKKQTHTHTFTDREMDRVKANEWEIIVHTIQIANENGYWVENLTEEKN